MKAKTRGFSTNAQLRHSTDVGGLREAFVARSVSPPDVTLCQGSEAP